MSDSLQKLSPEEKLLISLCRLEFSSNQKSEIRNQINNIKDWNKFVNMSNRHGIIALCWYNILETENSQFIPAKEMEILHNGYLKSLARNTKIYTLLDEVLKLSEEAGIKVVLLKGLALEKTIYGNKGLRQMNDLDILVKREDAIKLRKILLKNGFESDPMFSSLHEKILPNYGKHLPEIYKNGLTVEIHFNLFDKDGRRLTEEFINYAKEEFNCSKNVYFPSPILHFVYLLKHLDFHERTGTSQLRLYSDLVLTYLKSPELAISDSLIKFAKEAGIEKVLANKIYLLKSFFDLDFAIFETQMQIDGDKDKIEEDFIRYLQSPSKGSGQSRESLLKPLSDQPDIYNKALFILGNIFPSLTFMKFRYRTKSKIGAFAYYPVRWFKLLGILFSGKS